MDKDDSHQHFHQRDSLTLKLLGIFFFAFGGLVWIGLFWEQPPEGRVVNAVAGLLLVLSGVVSCFAGVRLDRGKEAESDREP